MNEKIKELVLEDAIQQYIEAEIKIIKLKRTLACVLCVCGVLAACCVCLLALSL